MRFQADMLDGAAHAAKALADRHIIHNDLHAGNVMRRKTGELVLFDIGGTSSAPAASITKLAAQFKGLP